MCSRIVDVAVVGGGLGGLATACGLQERGFDVHLFEAAPELRTATSTLLGLGENAFRALELLCPRIMEILPQEGVQTKEIMRIEKQTKESEPAVTTQVPSLKLMTFRWAKVQNTLASIVDPSRVHCGYKATSYTEVPDNEGGGVLLHFKDKPDMRARFAVAADGLKSPLRATMLPQDPGPRYLGHMNFNALLYNPGGKETVDAHDPGQLRVFTDVPMGMFNILCMVIDAGGGYTFWQLRIRSEQPSFTQHLGKGSSSSDVHAPDLPYLVGGGLGVAGSKARVLDILDKAGLDDVARVVQATPEASIFERAMFDRIPLDELPPSSTAGAHASPASAGNRVLLLGDAFHAAHSGPGQGARSAFEDAHQLSDILQAHRSELRGWKTADSAKPPSSYNDAGGLKDVVDEYTALRLTRVCRMQRMAAEGCGLPELREHSKVAGMARCPNCPVPTSPEELRQRWQEFSRWFEKYPAHPQGDPESTYWKPPPRYM